MASVKLCSSSSYVTRFISQNIKNHSHPSNKSKLSIYNSISYDHPQGFSQGPQVSHEELLIRLPENLNNVRHMLRSGGDSLESLITIDTLQRLSIDYHFEEEISNILNSFYKNLKGVDEGGLYDVVLVFRILRQHGFHVSSNVFKKFVNKEGRFELSRREDVRGLIELYEASHLNTCEEGILDEANSFAGERLRATMVDLEPWTSELVEHTLKHPFHLSVARHHSEYHLNRYQRGLRRNKALEELTAADFAIVRTLHQKEMQEISRWWKDLGLAEEISFARDQPSEWFMWAMTMLSEPQFSRHRIELMKPVSLIYIIDDIFDVYGTLDELILFTEAIKRWDIASMDLLPSHMKISCMALYNLTNEIAYFVYKEHRWNPIDSLRRAWEELCDTFLVEARWFASGHIPKPEEYMKNAVISSAMHMLCVNIFFLMGEQITKESIDYLEGHPTIISSPAMILRLLDDLGKAKDGKHEGFDGSYLECYLKENPNSSVENAKKHMKGMILDAWKRLNRECLSSPEPFSRRFVQSSLNGARVVRSMYDYDGHFPENQVNSLFY